MEVLLNYNFSDHPLDIFRAAIQCHKKSIRFAFAFVLSTDGGSVRRPGAVMLVKETGDYLGYVSGGCIDADVCAQAQLAIKNGQSQKIRYGQGSKYIDLKLPCGNGIDIHIIPEPDMSIIQSVSSLLNSRQPAELFIAANGTLSQEAHSDQSRFSYMPRMKLRIAGRGHDALALSQLALQSGLSVKLQCPDIVDLKNASARIEKEHLISSDTLSDIDDDPFTAFVMMFHDTAWEGHLLKQALEGSAFFVGAVGSRTTHLKRCEILRALDVAEIDIERIKAPIGLIPSMRDSSMLAISALADIAKSFHETHL